MWLFLGPSCSTSYRNQIGAGVSASERPPVAVLGQKASRQSMPGVGMALGTAALLAAGLKFGQKASSGTVACRARGWFHRQPIPGQDFKSPIVGHVPTVHKIPVVDLEGNEIGEEDMQFKTYSKETANYVVHQAWVIWEYQQKKFTTYLKRRSDMKHGKKPYKQKGTGRARHGTMYSPLFGKSATNKQPHGLDNKRKKKFPRVQHLKAISTVLQSKWKGIKIVDGLEDIEESRYFDLCSIIENVTGLEPGKRSTLMIARNAGGKEDYRGLPTPDGYRSPLYMAGRLIDRFQMRRPRDIDAESDGLSQCLKARKLLISREAWADLVAKFNHEDGWAFMTERDILVKQLQDLVKEYPHDRQAEFEAAMLLPHKLAAREFWAKEEREKKTESALS